MSLHVTYASTTYSTSASRQLKIEAPRLAANSDDEGHAEQTPSGGHRVGVNPTAQTKDPTITRATDEDKRHTPVLGGLAT
jgi:hypothetical protein